jgi:hypothetical protein
MRVVSEMALGERIGWDDLDLRFIKGTDGTIGDLNLRLS